MLFIKLANKIINKQAKSQRDRMTDFMVYYEDLDTKYQAFRMTYIKDKTTCTSYNLIYNRDIYNKKIKLEATRIPIILNIVDRWERINSIRSPYQFTYRLDDGDREAIYNFKGIPEFGPDIVSVKINNNKTGVWITIKCKNNNSRLLLFSIEKISISTDE